MVPKLLDLNEAVAELADRIRSYVVDFDRFEDPAAPTELFHYSSLATAQNILTSNVIRASDIFYFNDASEVSYGAEVVAECLASNLVFPRDIREIFSRAAESGPNNRFLQIARSWALHVFCLSAEADLLSQWRAYGGSGGGIAIGFDRSGLWSLYLDDQSPLPRPTVIPVIYDKYLQRTIIRSLIEIVEDGSRRLASEINQTTFWEAAAGNLAWCSQRFKNPAFFEEREWRLLWMSVPENKIRFRPAAQGLIPYTEVRFDRRVVTKVIQGPLLNPAIGEGALRKFLDSESYSNVPIARSVIPLRAL